MQARSKRRKIVPWLAFPAVGLALAASRPAVAVKAAGQLTTAQAVVTVVSKKSGAPRELSRANVLVFQQHQRRPVLNWVRAAGSTEPLDLAILVDDSLGSAFDNQIRDLREFVQTLPQSAKVAVVYSTNSNANFLSPFTHNHEQAAHAFRLPLGRANEVSSIYLALADLFRRWPPDPGRGRAVLLVSDGIDLYRGVQESVPGENPDLDQAIQGALKNHCPVYTIYASNAGPVHRDLFLLTNGQSSLSLLSQATGGASFFQGLNTPISLSPYLKRLSQLLSSRYVLTFSALPVLKAGLQPVKITTEVPDVRLIAPSEVWVLPVAH